MKLLLRIIDLYLVLIFSNYFTHAFLDSYAEASRPRPMKRSCELSKVASHQCTSTFLIRRQPQQSSFSSLSCATDNDYQSDKTRFGRGEMHLSALIEEGDVVLYQTGSWLVDGVRVGDDSPPTIRYAQVETIQIVWTHNCEHGVIRGADMFQQKNGQGLVLGNDSVQFGPEQLLARLTVEWDPEGKNCFITCPIEYDRVKLDTQ